MHLRGYSHVAAALVIFSLSSVSAFWRMNCDVIQTGRIDPIINPGALGAHCHTIVGGSNIGVNATYESLLNSNCNSCELTLDKSAYWTPNLYFQHSNGTFEEVPHTGSVIYYLARGFRNDGQQIYTIFPKGFKMVSGNKAARAYNQTGMTWGNDTYPSRSLSEANSYACLEADGAPQTYGLDNPSQCINGMRAQLHFQTCWNGVDLYKSDNSHVAHLNQIDNGICPTTHPHLFPHIFMETNYATALIEDTDGGQFLFSMGDPTGYGFHGDFQNAWQSSVLQKAMDNCLTQNEAGTIEECDILQSTRQLEYGYNCPEMPLQVDEPVHGLLDKLPGCINVTPGPAMAKASDMECGAGVVHASISKTVDSYPMATANPPIGKVYGNAYNQYMGCFNDTVYSLIRTLNANYTTSPNMTNEYCQSYCTGLGYRYSGLEFGVQCYCDLAINPTAQFYAGVNLTYGCDISCPGNRVELCGGAQYMTVFENTDPAFVSTTDIANSAYQLTVPVAPFASNYMGCWSESTTGNRALNATTSSSATMSVEECASFCVDYAYYGVEYANQCWCGNGLAGNSALVDQSQDPNVSSCNMRCVGEYSEVCGGSGTLSVYSNPNYTPVVISSGANGFSLVGCYQDGGARTLRHEHDDNGMTVEKCTAYCYDEGYIYAGVEYGVQCFCDSAIQNTPTAVELTCPYGFDLKLCGGNKYEYCGAGNLLIVYLYNNVSSSGGIAID